MVDVIQSSFSKTPGNIPPHELIGIPPSFVYEEFLMEELTYNSVPVMAIYPAYPEYGDQVDQKMGLQLYSLNHQKGVEKYNQILASAGIESIKGNCIYVAFLADSSISETFNVEYGESKFEEIGNMASSTLSELGYITGQSTINDAAGSISKYMDDQGAFGKILGGLTNAAGSVGGAISNFIDKRAPGMSKLLMGHKIDFPMIWKGASFSPSYQATIRLYNPNPRSMEDYETFIVKPLAKLIALAIPISSSESTFMFPVTCSVSCPGLFKIKAGFVSSLEVIKGGEANDVSYKQRPGMVDVRISFGELYSTMIADGEDSSTGQTMSSRDKFRPTFGDYVKQLYSEAEVPELRRKSFTEMLLEDTGVEVISSSVSTKEDSNIYSDIVSRLSSDSIVINASLGGMGQKAISIANTALDVESIVGEMFPIINDTISSYNDTGVLGLPIVENVIDKIISGLPNIKELTNVKQQIESTGNHLLPIIDLITNSSENLNNIINSTNNVEIPGMTEYISGILESKEIIDYEKLNIQQGKDIFENIYNNISTQVNDVKDRILNNDIDLVEVAKDILTGNSGISDIIGDIDISGKSVADIINDITENRIDIAVVAENILTNSHLVSEIKSELTNVKAQVEESKLKISGSIGNLKYTYDELVKLIGSVARKPGDRN